MIILDTSILRSFSPESSSADLLRAIRAVGAQRVAVPWMVMEELAAQQAMKYQERFEEATQAVEALSRATPWGLEVPIGLCESDGIREHWRDKWGAVVETIPTSDEALRQAAFREANCLPPCKSSKGAKTGSRDAAIWLSAVEYAQQHPDETVYFTSANTRDFGNGSEYPALMRADIAGMEDRFVHWTDLDQVVTHFTQPAATDENQILDILAAPAVIAQVPPALFAGGFLTMNGSFFCTSLGHLEADSIIPAHGWSTGNVRIGAVEAAQMYRIGEEEWCTAVVHWQLLGTVVTERGGVTWANCGCTAAVLFRPNVEDPRLTVLRAELPQPLDEEAFSDVRLPRLSQAGPEQAVAMLLRQREHSVPFESDYHPYRGHRAYEGAVLRVPFTENLKYSDIPPGG